MKSVLKEDNENFESEKMKIIKNNRELSVKLDYSILSNTSNDVDTSSYQQASPIQRRGRLETGYANNKFDMSIPQKRYLEYKVEKERNDREELQENYNVLQREFTKFKERSVQNELKLSDENCKLKSLVREQSDQLQNLQSTIDSQNIQLQNLENALKAEVSNNSKNHSSYRSQLKLLKEAETAQIQKTREWFLKSEEFQKKMIDKYDELIERIVSFAVKSYSSYPIAPRAGKAVLNDTKNMNNNYMSNFTIDNFPSNNEKQDNYDSASEMIRIMNHATLLPPYKKSMSTPKGNLSKLNAVDRTVPYNKFSDDLENRRPIRRHSTPHEILENNYTQSYMERIPPRLTSKTSNFKDI